MLTLKKRNLIFLLITSTLIGVMLTLGVGATYGHITEQTRISREDYKEFKSLQTNYGELAELQKLIEEKYYIPVETGFLKEGIYKGLFAGIGDPYSAYLTKKEYEELLISTTGEYQGIGVTIAPDEADYINVVAPMDSSPAEKAGIKSGDKIIAVNGESYTGKTIDAAASAMRGKEGTKVELKILRGADTIDMEITRAKITLETVYSEMLDNDIGYIRISSFEEQTADDFGEALKNIESLNAKGLVIDLRDNPGGLVDVSIKVADYLLQDGVVTYTEDRKGKKKHFRSKKGATELPFTLLINGGSASASEIIAGAVKDYNAGEVVGVTSYGKGIIQEIIPLEGGGATKLTIMQYYSPKGNVIHQVGVKPDHEVILSEQDYVNGILPKEKDKQLQKAVDLLQ